MLTVEVLSPERPVHRTTGAEVIFPTTGGELGIRTGHLPLIAQLKPGTIVVKHDKEADEVLAVLGGFVEVFENNIYVMADSAELASDLDELKIQEAIARAEALQKEATGEHELQTASALLAHNLVRMKAVQRHRHSHQEHTDHRS
jgi:F-type H+-transporting ATPase subunit epsilon